MGAFGDLFVACARFGANLARRPRADEISRELDRAARDLSTGLGPLGRQVHRVGDRAREGLLDVAGTDGRVGTDAVLLDAWRRLDLTGLADRGRDEHA